MAEEYVDIRVRLQDAQRVLTQLEEEGAAVRKVGTEAEVAGAKARSGAGGFNMFRKGSDAAKRGATGLMGKLKEGAKSWASAAKGLLAFGAGFATFEGVKKSVDTTEQLGIASLRLHRNMGLNIQDASAWGSVAKMRNIDLKQLQMGFTILSRNIEGATSGSKKQVAAFQSLGVSTAELKAHHGDFNWILGKVSDGLKAMPGGAQRAALAQQLLGRGAQNLMPILNMGTKGIKEQMDMARKYGATLGLHSVKDVKKFIEQQHEAKFAMMGFQVSIGTTVIPILTKLLGIFNHVVLSLRQGKGVTSTMSAAFKGLGLVLSPLFKFFTQTKVGAHLLGVALTVLIGLMIATKLKTWGTALLDTAKALKIATAAQWLWNIALDANPIVLIVIAIIAIGAALVLAYMKVKWFRDAVNAAWKWIKTAAVNTWNAIKSAFRATIGALVGAFNAFVGFWVKGWNKTKSAFNAVINFVKDHWRLIIIILLGPLGIAIAGITKYWGKIKSGASAVVGFLKGVWNGFVHALEALFARIGRGFGKMWDGAKAGGKAAINAIIDLFNLGIHAINAATPGSIKVAGHTIVPGIPDIPDIPHLWAGGIIDVAGLSLVGDQGPEILSLPRGARVDPLPSRLRQPQLASPEITPMSAKLRDLLEVHAHVYLKGHEIAHALGEDASTRKARR